MAFNQGNTFTGNVLISGGTVNATGGTGFAGVFGKTGTITIANATLDGVSGNNGPFGNPGSLVAGNIIVQTGGLLTIGASTTAHVPRLLVLSGGALGSSSTVLATYGTWNLDQGVMVNGGVNGSVISASSAINGKRRNGFQRWQRLVQRR